jgi:hypothetical protein
MIRITFNNYKYIIPEKEQTIVNALLEDIETINNKYLTNKGSIWLSFEDEHTQYSPERTEPCPDYYGYYRLHNSLNDDTLGIEMTLDELDSNLCTLINFCETFLKN